MISSGNRSLTINEFKTMKKIYSFMVAAVAMIAAVSCNKEFSNDNLFGGDVITLRASVDGADTKAQLVEGKSQWEANDAISVLNGTSGFKFTTADEGKSANFTYDNTKGDFTGEEFIAVYPASKGYAYSANLGEMTVNAHIPTWQEAVVDSYHKDAALSVAYTENNELYFMNAVALLKFTVSEQNVKNVTFFANDKSAVSGNVKIIMNKDGSEIESVEGLQTTNFGFEPDSDKVYMKPSYDWISVKARYAAYFFGNGDTWVDMSDPDGDDVYEASVPTDKVYPNVIFCRMDPSATANVWDNKWNQTGDLTVTTDAIYEVSGWDAGEWKTSTLALRNYVELYAPNNGTLAVGEAYYMAVVPKEYAAGFSVQLKIGDGDKTTVKTLTTSYEVKPNMILDLGELRLSKKERDMKFDKPSVAVVVGETVTAPTLSGETSGVTYVSSNTNVATVDPSGNVTILKAGTTTITASAPENETYYKGDASYKLIVNDTHLYLKPNSNWTQAGARFAAYFFGNGETWVDMTKESDGTYKVKKPTSKTYPNVIFCRMNPSATANNWNNKWNQTGDLKVPTDGTNLFTIPNGSWDGATASWSTK